MHAPIIPLVNRSLIGTFDNAAPVWFEFEKTFPHETVREWFRNNKHLSIYLGIIYVCTTLIGRRIMDNKPRMELRKTLLIWNIIMAVFSIFLAVRISPFFFRRLYHSTLYGAICDGTYENVTQIIMWLEIFVITKAIEFIDTLFIVLRKQHLAFIHWYHHATVVIVCWYAEGANFGPANCIYYVALNSIVHSFMYTYYGLRAARFRVPRIINICITSMQISQMMVGIFINMAAAYYMFLRNDRPCDDDPQQIFVALSVYLSYFFLFCQFFYNAYLRKSDVNGKTPSPMKISQGVACANGIRAANNDLKVD